MPAAGPQAQPIEPRLLVVRVRGDRAEVLVLGDQPLPPGKYVGAVAVTDRRKGASDD